MVLIITPNQSKQKIQGGLVQYFLVQKNELKRQVNQMIRRIEDLDAILAEIDEKIERIHTINVMTPRDQRRIELYENIYEERLSERQNLVTQSNEILNRLSLHYSPHNHVRNNDDAENAEFAD